MKRIPMTKLDEKLLQEELEQRKNVDRRRITNAIAEAKAHGDLKENAEYHSATEKQGHVEGRIAQLQDIIANAQVIDPSTLENDSIVLGATVELINVETEEESTIQIVGSDESDSSKGKISFTSPLRKALIGKSEGDTVIVRAPKGDIEYEVVEFEYK